MKNLFLIIGAPGSGKTTDASLIASSNNTVAHFSTGDLLRDEVSKKTELGNKINDFISKGNLVPLEIVISAIISAIKGCDKDYIIIDGYPRSVEQMQKLDEILKDENEIKLISVIEIEVSKQTAQNRVLGRNRGDDDNVEVFNNRMDVFLKPLEDIRKFYKEKEIYKIVDGERSIDEIVADINEIIIKAIAD